jgi:hypothetical protein
VSNNLLNLITDPREITVATGETITVAVDVSKRLNAGTPSPITPTSQLVTNDGTETVIALTDECSVSGTQIRQEIRGTELVAGCSYLLSVAFGDGVGNTQQAFVIIDCPI